MAGGIAPESASSSQTHTKSINKSAIKWGFKALQSSAMR
jgi:hypothetical protein